MARAFSTHAFSSLFIQIPSTHKVQGHTLAEGRIPISIAVPISGKMSYVANVIPARTITPIVLAVCLSDHKGSMVYQVQDRLHQHLPGIFLMRCSCTVGGQGAKQIDSKNHQQYFFRLLVPAHCSRDLGHFLNEQRNSLSQTRI